MVDKLQSIADEERRSYLRKLVNDKLELTDFGRYQEECVLRRDLDEITKFYQDVETAKTLKKFSNSVQFGKCKYEDIPLATDEGYKGITVRLDWDQAEQIIQKQNKNSYYHKFVNDEGQWEIKSQWEIERDNESLDDIANEIQDVLTDTSKVLYDLEKSQVYTPNFEDDEKKNFDSKSGFEHYVERIRGGFFATLSHSNYRLPGNAFSYDSCGKFFVKGCVSESHGHEHDIQYDFVERLKARCGRLTCPECFEDSIHRTSSRISNRLEAAAVMLRSKIYQNPRKRIFIHGVWSAPEEDYKLFETKEGTKKLYAKMRKQLTKVGIVGHVEITHPFRFDKDQDGVPYFSPHIHFIALGYVDGKKVKANYESTKCVIKIIGSFHNVKQLKVRLSYLLSHAGLRKNEDVVRYAGQLSYNKFKTDRILQHSLEFEYDVTNSLDKLNLFDVTKNTHTKIPSSCMVSAALMQYSKYDEKEVSITDIIQRDNMNFELSTSADFGKFKKDMIRFVSSHKDNPALPPTKILNDKDYDQEEPKLDVMPSKFLVIRADYRYTIEKTKTITKYHIIILSNSVSNICPICLQKLRLIVPIDKSKSDLVMELPLDQGVCVDRGLYEQVQGYDILGKMLWNEQGKILYDSKVGIEPEFMDKYPEGYQYEIRDEIKKSKLVYQFKVNHGRAPTKQDIKDMMSVKVSSKEYKTTQDIKKISTYF